MLSEYACVQQFVGSQYVGSCNIQSTTFYADATSDFKLTYDFYSIPGYAEPNE
jgi:hypothetical protein